MEESTRAICFGSDVLYYDMQVVWLVLNVYRLTLVLSLLPHEDIHMCDMFSQLPPAASVLYWSVIYLSWKLF